MTMTPSHLSSTRIRIYETSRVRRAHPTQQVDEESINREASPSDDHLSVNEEPTTDPLPHHPKGGDEAHSSEDIADHNSEQPATSIAIDPRVLHPEIHDHANDILPSSFEGFQDPIPSNAQVKGFQNLTLNNA